MRVTVDIKIILQSPKLKPYVIQKSKCRKKSLHKKNTGRGQIEELKEKLKRYKPKNRRKRTGAGIQNRRCILN